MRFIRHSHSGSSNGAHATVSRRPAKARPPSDPRHSPSSGTRSPRGSTTRRRESRRSGRARARCRRAAACRIRAPRGRSRTASFASSSVMPSRWKIARLQRGVVNPDAAAADFAAVQHEVVGLCAHRAGFALELVDVLVVRRRERMVHRIPAAVVLVVLEQREIGDPEELERVRVQQVLLLRDREAELAEQLRRRRPAFPPAISSRSSADAPHALERGPQRRLAQRLHRAQRRLARAAPRSAR